MREELISVIVPVYNVQKYLPKCIESLQNQTYKNLEIILVDDGATDDSGKICDEYAKKDSRIKVIHKKNGGLSDARNYGIEAVTGEFISFIDSDDFVSDDFYEYLMKLQKKSNADIAECKFIKAYEKELDTFKFPMLEEDATIVTSGNGALYLFMSDDDEISTNSVVVWNKIYRKELFKNVRFPVGKTHEDQFTTYRLLANCKTFITSNQMKYGYFQRSDSIVNKKFNANRFDTFEAFDNFLDFYEKNGYVEFKEKILRRYLKTAINFIALLNGVEGENLILYKQKLEKLFSQKYKYTIDFIQGTPIHKDKMNMYEKLKEEFYSKIGI